MMARERIGSGLSVPGSNLELTIPALDRIRAFQLAP
jgi:hypothetical protein